MLVDAAGACWTHLTCRRLSEAWHRAPAAPESPASNAVTVLPSKKRNQRAFCGSTPTAAPATNRCAGDREASRYFSGEDPERCQFRDDDPTLTLCLL